MKCTYICPHCNKICVYKSKHRWAPKYISTNCSSCKKRVFFKRDAIKQSNQPIKANSYQNKKAKTTSKSNQNTNLTHKGVLNNSTPNSKSAQNTNQKNFGAIGYTSKIPVLVRSQTRDDMFSVHAIRFKIPIVKVQPYFKWDQEVQLNGWKKRLYIGKDFKLELTPHNLIINISRHIYGNSPEQIILFAERYAWEIVSSLEKQGFRFISQLSLVQKPHIVLPKNAFPDISAQHKYLFQDSSGAITIDDTPHADSIEIYGLETINKMAKAANEIEDLKKLIAAQAQLQTNMIQTLFNAEQSKQKRGVSNGHETFYS